MKKKLYILLLFLIPIGYTLTDPSPTNNSAQKTYLTGQNSERKNRRYLLASKGLRQACGIKKTFQRPCCYPSTPYRNPNYRPLFWNPIDTRNGFAK